MIYDSLSLSLPQNTNEKLILTEECIEMRVHFLCDTKHLITVVSTSFSPFITTRSVGNCVQLYGHWVDNVLRFSAMCIVENATNANHHHMIVHLVGVYLDA